MRRGETDDTDDTSMRFLIHQPKHIFMVKQMLTLLIWDRVNLFCTLRVGLVPFTCDPPGHRFTPSKKGAHRRTRLLRSYPFSHSSSFLTKSG